MTYPAELVFSYADKDKAFELIDWLRSRGADVTVLENSFEQANLTMKSIMETVNCVTFMEATFEINFRDAEDAAYAMLRWGFKKPVSE